MKCKELNKRNPRGAGSKPKFAKKYKTKYIKVLLPVDAEREMKGAVNGSMKMIVLNFGQIVMKIVSHF